MNARRRTILGILLFIPLAAVILATIACLPVPVGDPEQSKVDPALNGAYQAISTDPAEKDKTTLAILTPWDSHTYLLQYVTSDDPAAPEVTNFKAWLTELGGATFLTAQPMETIPGFATGSGPDEKPYWAVFRLDGAKSSTQGHPGKTADVIRARMVDDASPLFKDLDKDHPPPREAVEAIIKAHAGDDALYSDKPIDFKKLGEADAAMIGKVLSAAHATVAIQTEAASKPGSMP